MVVGEVAFVTPAAEQTMFTSGACVCLDALFGDAFFDESIFIYTIPRAPLKSGQIVMISGFLHCS